MKKIRIISGIIATCVSVSAMASSVSIINTSGENISQCQNKSRFEDPIELTLGVNEFINGIEQQDGKYSIGEKGMMPLINNSILSGIQIHSLNMLNYIPHHSGQYQFFFQIYENAVGHAKTLFLCHAPQISINDFKDNINYIVNITSVHKQTCTVSVKKT